VGVPSEGFETAIRLSDLRSAHAAGATLQNLLSALSAKIDACSRLKVFEYEAGSEGHVRCAATFRSLAEAERQSLHTLLACLREHLDEVSPLPAETAQGGQG
jgi:rubrerythrin